ncbi:hypothetical protein E2C01_088065 [Portunus trituberculatus]|uniref:Uncharacterized protein n=1 Tax=Portunus trituberculatus TaxID=210409 RepID=A0A5B7J9S7_PORTR|nr:hypothetical protein [Portunus trituberculatus]
MLSAVDQSDTGEYSCSPTALEPAEITVHVQDDYRAVVLLITLYCRWLVVNKPRSTPVIVSPMLPYVVP